MNFARLIAFRRKVQLKYVLSGAQALVATLVMFAGYRLLILEVGIEETGLWSLLLSMVSLARVMDATGAGGLARFVSKAKVDGDDASLYIHTLCISTGILYSIVAGIVYFFSSKLLSFPLEEENFADGLLLMPYAIVLGLLITPIASMLASAIDGIHRADIRACLMIASYLVMFISLRILLSEHGIKAWAIAMMIQQVFIIVGSWVILRLNIPNMGSLPYRFSWPVVKETFSYGLKLQASMVAGILSEPLAKLYLNKYSGLEAVGLYDLAARILLAIRGIVVQVAVPLVPEFSALYKNKRQAIELLRKARRASTIASLLMVIVVSVSSPFYSYIMLGVQDYTLICMIIILAFGYAANTISIPEHYLGVGLNYMRWNILGQFCMALIVATFGWLLGRFFGELGVVVSVALGSTAAAYAVSKGNSKFIYRS